MAVMFFQFDRNKILLILITNTINMKKINSEILFDNKDFKLKMGTVDKKNPTTIYLTAGTYVTPASDIEDFKKSIDLMTKKITKNTQNMTKDSEMIENDHILITDIATDRVMVGKKSYFEVALYMKPKKQLLHELNNNFHSVATKLHDNYAPQLLEMIGSEIASAGYAKSKNKS